MSAFFSDITKEPSLCYKAVIDRLTQAVHAFPNAYLGTIDVFGDNYLTRFLCKKFRISLKNLNFAPKIKV